LSNPAVPGLVIERTGDVLTFTLDNADHGNQVTGAMFDAMLATLQEEASRNNARVLRIRSCGRVFCTGRERAGRDVEAIRSGIHSEWLTIPATVPRSATVAGQ
jgi:methylglutaconyl-CoA hydratase